MLFEVRIYIVILFGLISGAYTYPVQAQEQEIPKWEFGLGLGGLSIPHYRGSDQRKEYLAPVPYVRYNGERLKVDREGGRFFFYDSDDLKLDISASFSLPVDSDENRARQGMPDLDTVIELGPRMQFYLYESKDRSFRVRAALPVRAAIATDLSQTSNVGWIFSPYLQLRYFNEWESAISIGPLWATEKYHDYYYQVNPEYATATRPAFDASGGYSGSRITITSSKRFKRFWAGVFIRYDDLSGTAFRSSPLLRQDDSLMLGIAVTYIFKQSKQAIVTD